MSLIFDSVCEGCRKVQWEVLHQGSLLCFKCAKIEYLKSKTKPFEVMMKRHGGNFFRYECELVGGPKDGFEFDRITRTVPKIGMRLHGFGGRYQLTRSRNGKAIFEWR